jgi:predicted PurR-regulated permease PerM
MCLFLLQLFVAATTDAMTFVLFWSAAVDDAILWGIINYNL